MTNFFTRKKIFPLQPSCIAAMIIAVVIMSLVFYWLLPPSMPASPQSEIPVFTHQRYRNDVDPAAEEALLTLQDGAELMLIDTINGVLAHEGSKRAPVIKEDGWLYYGPTELADSVLYHTLAIPSSCIYKLKLPDGTKVWLNGGSSIKYQLSFGRKERRVLLNGEAYFEVAPTDHPLPFVVHTPTAPGKVIASDGPAHFNVTAYETAHNAYVTVLNGAVHMNSEVSEIRLIPGQGGFIDQGGKLARISGVSGANAIAWRDRLFTYQDADIHQVMNQIARTYNVRVDFDQRIHDRFSGVLNLGTPLTTSLSQMEKAGTLRFSIDNRRVVVMR